MISHATIYHATIYHATIYHATIYEILTVHPLSFMRNMWRHRRGKALAVRNFKAVQEQMGLVINLFKIWHSKVVLLVVEYIVLGNLMRNSRTTERTLVEDRAWERSRADIEILKWTFFVDSNIHQHVYLPKDLLHASLPQWTNRNSYISGTWKSVWNLWIPGSVSALIQKKFDNPTFSFWSYRWALTISNDVGLELDVQRSLAEFNVCKPTFFSLMYAPLNDTHVV